MDGVLGIHIDVEAAKPIGGIANHLHSVQPGTLHMLPKQAMQERQRLISTPSTVDTRNWRC